jgi:hypothetical protein
LFPGEWIFAIAARADCCVYHRQYFTVTWLLDEERDFTFRLALS